MKKLLGLLAATGLVASTGSVVVACGENTPDVVTIDLDLTSNTVTLDISTAVDAGENEKEVTIVNFADLGELNIAQANPAVVLVNQVKVSEEGKFTLIAVQEGNTVVTITSDIEDVESVEITVNVIDSSKEQISSESIEAAVKAELEGEDEFADLTLLNAALAAIEIDGVTSLVAVADTTPGNAIVTITVASTHTLVGSTTFTLEGVLEVTEPSNKIEISSEDISAEVVGQIDGAKFATIELLNEELASITIDGVESLIAVEDEISGDAIVTITIDEENYVLVGALTFTLEGVLDTDIEAD
ncbi:hypothetical protein SCLARK_001628 [Spiroplasma clarkii]|uniref:Spiralin n=1 Tax=Spiroplasma clarkii TaxID=2139 RepID=A0A1Y0L263_9MOLU|nr:lipoprotein [Spiroplasma clarkii]ARU92102.1 hypothetical protein SCLARK_001628 [Spiroplasma clarkii]ATX71440.1 hypothetical protein SCLAR_v1c11400 [Spiroplasma clarkii]